MKKKILWIILLILIIVAVVVGIAIARKQEAKTTSGTNKPSKLADSTETAEEIADNNENEEKEYKKVKLKDGTLYSLTGGEVEADVVLTDNYFDTTINDMWLNPDSYKGKLIQIEGMYLENLPYMFVGRYSASNLCPNCPPGYSYFEYVLNGKLDRKFTDEKEWIKVVGTCCVGNDETTNFTDFYYLDVITLEVMNERGQETVNN